MVFVQAVRKVSARKYQDVCHAFRGLGIGFQIQMAEKTLYEISDAGFQLRFLQLEEAKAVLKNPKSKMNWS
jgi:hypothetical protein